MCREARSIVASLNELAMYITKKASTATYKRTKEGVEFNSDSQDVKWFIKWDLIIVGLQWIARILLLLSAPNLGVIVEIIERLRKKP